MIVYRAHTFPKGY